MPYFIVNSTLKDPSAHAQGTIYPSQTILQNFLLCISRAFTKLNFGNSPSYYLQSNLPKPSQTALQLNTAK